MRAGERFSRHGAVAACARTSDLNGVSRASPLITPLSSPTGAAYVDVLDSVAFTHGHPAFVEAQTPQGSCTYPLAAIVSHDHERCDAKRGASDRQANPGRAHETVLSTLNTVVGGRFGTVAGMPPREQAATWLGLLSLHVLTAVDREIGARHEAGIV
jgi:hypothetical protein